MGRGRLAASHGIQQAISTPASPKPAPQTVAQQAPVYHKVNWLAHQTIMHEMGQDGTEGQGYVNTSQAYIVNRFLRNGGDMADAHKATPNWDWITKSDVQRTIKRMDSQMRPMSRNIQGVRYAGTDALRSFGISAGAADSKTVSAIQQWMSRTGGHFTDQAYTSFSTDNNANVFKAKSVKFNYRIRKGAKAIMTANRVESEGVLARGISQRVTGVRLNDGKLEIDVEV